MPPRMTPRNLLIGVLALIFVGGIAYALQRELAREELIIQSSISGVVEIDPELYRRGLADIVKTDRLVLLLVDPQSGEVRALGTESPFVPPQTIIVGQRDARSPLAGSYLVVGISDKDGEIFRVVRGEVYGRSAEPIALGSERFRLVLNQPYRGGLFNGQFPAGLEIKPRVGSGNGGSAKIEGTIHVAPGLAGQVAPHDRVVLLVFSSDQRRPVATRVYPRVTLPLPFSIDISAQAVASSPGGFYLRVLTDKDNNPVNAVPGEIIGRSTTPVPAGSTGVTLEMNEPYTR